MALREGGIYVLPNGRELVVAGQSNCPGVVFELIRLGPFRIELNMKLTMPGGCWRTEN